MVVMNRMPTHISSNFLISQFESAYREFHSTQSALHAIHNDIMCCMGKAITLVLIHWSAAFETWTILFHFIVSNIGLGVPSPASNSFSVYPHTQWAYLHGNYSSSYLLTLAAFLGVLCLILFCFHHTSHHWVHCSTSSHFDIICMLRLSKSTNHFTVCFVTRRCNCCPLLPVSYGLLKQFPQIAKCDTAGPHIFISLWPRHFHGQYISDPRCIYTGSIWKLSVLCGFHIGMLARLLHICNFQKLK